MKMRKAVIGNVVEMATDENGKLHVIFESAIDVEMRDEVALPLSPVPFIITPYPYYPIGTYCGLTLTGTHS